MCDFPQQNLTTMCSIFSLQKIRISIITENEFICRFGDPSLKRGEVINSEGTFNILIAKAEEGDSEVKFNVGKCFIMDCTKKENEDISFLFYERREDIFLVM